MLQPNRNVTGCAGPGDTLLKLSDDGGRISLDYVTQRKFDPGQSFRGFSDVHETGGPKRKNRRMIRFLPLLATLAPAMAPAQTLTIEAIGTKAAKA